MKALITGIHGQDGAYLARHLLSLGYEVIGGARRSAQRPWRLEALGVECEIMPLELTEYESVRFAVQRVRPDEIYNLAAQSHVGMSFKMPEYTAKVNYLGVMHVLEAARYIKTKVYQASTSEMFGSSPPMQDENTRFHPRSPYGVAKLAAHTLCVNYRESYKMPISCGILFNHESPLRGEEFVTRKIVSECVRYGHVELGNLTAVRDWGHAEDYVKAMHLMLQHEPDDFVIATGAGHTVQEFADAVIGMGDDWSYNSNPNLFRPAEVEALIGNPARAKEVLGWVPEHTFDSLVRDMVAHECKKGEGLYAEAKGTDIDINGNGVGDRQSGDRRDVHLST